MSDPKTSYGEPVEEPRPVDDVVGRAEEGLADAEAAGRDAVGDETAPASSRNRSTRPRRAEAIRVDPSVDDEPEIHDAPRTTRPLRLRRRAGRPPSRRSPRPHRVGRRASPSPTPSSRRAVVGSGSRRRRGAAPCSRSSSRRPKRLARAATVPPPERSACSPHSASRVLYLAAWLGFAMLRGDVAVGDIAATALGALGTWSLWVTVVVFFIAFWLLGAIINRGRWGAWVVFGLLVGFASYGGHLLGKLFQEPFWMMTASEGAQIVEDAAATRRSRSRPSSSAASCTIWFGAWVAARGKRGSPNSTSRRSTSTSAPSRRARSSFASRCPSVGNPAAVSVRSTALGSRRRPSSRC